MLGPEPTLFGKPKFSCMRLHYRCKGSSGYFHTLRAVIRSPEEDGKGMKEGKGNYSDRLVSSLLGTLVRTDSLFLFEWVV